VAIGTFQPGLTVAGYRLERLLGQGGMGVVYEAKQLSLDRIVALKIVAPQFSSDLSFRARFRRECLIQAKLEHPNIVTVYEAGEFEGTLFLAMRLVRGQSLKEMIVARELDSLRSLRILAAIADALDSAHEAKLIHRDIKPHNILVGAREHPYLADFGLTKGPGDTGLTRTGQFVGSLDYIAPEQIRGEPATAASDIYALAAVLFECLSGSVPYPKESEAAVLYAHVAEPPPKASDRRSSLPRALDPVLEHAMAKEPGERFASATELLRAAEHAFESPAREAMEVPPPATSLTELGIRPPEIEVDTVRPSNRPPTEPVTPEATEAVTRAERESQSTAPPAPTMQPADVPTAAQTAAGSSAGETIPPDAQSKPSSADPAQTAAASRARMPPREPARTTLGDHPHTPKLAGDVVLQTVAEKTPPSPTAAVERDFGVARATAPRADRARLPERARLRLPRAVVISAVAAGLAAAGFTIGHAGGSSTKTHRRSEQAGEVALQVPSGWPRSRTPASIPGLSFSTELSLDAQPAGASLFAGTLPAAGGKYLLPDAFLARLTRQPATHDGVQLGSAAAYRYRELYERGVAQPLTLFVVPTSAGVAAVGCRAPSAHSTFLTACEQTAATLRLVGATSLPLGPQPDYADKLSAAVARLKAAQPSERDLAAARTRAAQSSLSASLSRAHTNAAQMLARGKPGPDAASLNRELLAALRAAAIEFAAMSNAARAGQSDAYATARTNAARQQANARNDLAKLRAIGYGS
jgi:serine/threonine protein kinase